MFTSSLNSEMTNVMGLISPDTSSQSSRVCCWPPRRCWACGEPSQEKTTRRSLRRWWLVVGTEVLRITLTHHVAVRVDPSGFESCVWRQARRACVLLAEQGRPFGSGEATFKSGQVAASGFPLRFDAPVGCCHAAGRPRRRRFPAGTTRVAPSAPGDSGAALRRGCPTARLIPENLIWSSPSSPTSVLWRYRENAPAVSLSLTRTRAPRRSPAWQCGRGDS